MPRPLSVTVADAPSLWSVTVMRSAWPFMASSTELSTISQRRWWRPAPSTPPMYMPGRRRTGSSPSRTRMSFAVYVAAIVLLLHPPNGGHSAALDDLLPLASAPARRHVAGGELPLVALGRDREKVRLVRQRERANDAAVGAGLHENDASARSGELRHLVDRKAQHLPGGRGHHHRLPEHGLDRYDLVTVRDAGHAPSRTRRLAEIGRGPKAEPARRGDEDRRRGRALRRPEERPLCSRRLGRRHGLVTLQVRSHDALAVSELEERLHGLAVAGRRGDVGDPQHVERAVGRVEDQVVPRRPDQHALEGVAFAQARRRRVLQLHHAPQPAVAREEHRRLLVHDVGLGDVLQLLGLADARAALVAVRLPDALQVLPDDLPAGLGALQQRLDLLQACPLGGALLEDLRDLE